MGKQHGLIALDANGNLVVDSYGNAILFKTKEDLQKTVPDYNKIIRVVTAKVKRDKKESK